MLDLVNQLDAIAEWSAPQPPRRRCKHCTTLLRQSNPEDVCSLCYRKAVEADFQPILTNECRAYSKTGFKGVYQNKNKYVAQVVENGHTHYLGIFCTPELASQARVEWLAKRKV